MTGTLPQDPGGRPSYLLAKERITGSLHAVLREAMTEYGLTNLEAADILHDVLHSFLKWSVRQQQKGNKDRKGAWGTPREEERPPQRKKETL